MTFELRPYQTEAATKAIEDLKKIDKASVLMPTGAGKTETMIKICELFLAENRCSIMILSHLGDLTEQTTDRFKLRSPKITTGIFRAQQMPGFNTDVIISTMQTARDVNKSERLNKKLFKDVKLLIIDECHYLFNESYDKVFDNFEDCKIVGFTATPFRKNKLMTNFFDKISFSISMQELIDMKFLVPPKLKIIKTETNTVPELMAAVANTYKQFESGNSSIVYLRTIEQADIMRNIFVELGVKAESIHSQLGETERKERILKFRNKEIDVLTNVDVLTAGFDAPHIKSIFMPFKTDSVTQYLQRIGRGLRPHKDSGKEECVVYVHGSEPKILEGYYEQIQQEALQINRKIERDNSSHTNELDWLEINDKDSSEYVWCQKVCEVVNEMEKIGMTNFAKELDDKRFPSEFLQNFEDLKRNLPIREIKIPHGDRPLTEKQFYFLKYHGFEPAMTEGLNRREANMMIRSIKKTNTNKYTIANGRYEGYHVSELPYKYAEIVKRTQPQSLVACMIKNWEKEYRTTKKKSKKK